MNQGASIPSTDFQILKQERRLGLGNMVAQNVALVSKLALVFSLESFTSSFWDQVIKSKYGHHQSGWNANQTCTASHASP